jgi:hypothetical protein
MKIFASYYIFSILFLVFLVMEKTEAKIQQEAIMKIWNEMPETRLCLFHVPNGMNIDARQGAKFKAQGVISGVPDLVFVWAGKTHYIEVKTENGYLSKNQKALHQKWAEQGVEVKVMRSSDEIVNFISQLTGRNKPF